MKLLLDTCTFLWAIDERAQLSDRARALIVDPDNDVYLSDAHITQYPVRTVW